MDAVLIDFGGGGLLQPVDIDEGTLIVPQLKANESPLDVVVGGIGIEDEEGFGISPHALKIFVALSESEQVPGHAFEDADSRSGGGLVGCGRGTGQCEDLQFHFGFGEFFSLLEDIDVDRGQVGNGVGDDKMSGERDAVGCHADATGEVEIDDGEGDGDAFAIVDDPIEVAVFADVVFMSAAVVAPFLEEEFVKGFSALCLRRFGGECVADFLGHAFEAAERGFDIGFLIVELRDEKRASGEGKIVGGRFQEIAEGGADAFFAELIGDFLETCGLLLQLESIGADLVDACGV